MPLIPTNGVLAVVASVAKRDPEAAAELVRLGLYESLSDQIDEVRPVLEASAIAVVEKRAAAARTALLRTHVGKALSGEPEPEDLEVAKGLAILEEYVEVAKESLAGQLLALFNDQHPRGADGRFVRSDVAPDGKGLSADQKNRAALNAADHKVKGWQRDGALKDDMITAVFRDKDGKEHRVPTKASELEATAAVYAGDADNPMTLQAVSYNASAKLNGPKERGAFDAMRHFTGPEMAGRTARNMPTSVTPEQGDEWAANWNNLSDGTDRRSYRRMKMTGQALSGMSAPGSTMDSVGGLAQLMGDLGPEAEKVISPGIQRIAYRYRGTERRPDEELFSDINRAGALLDETFPDLPPELTDQAGRIKPARELTPQQRQMAAEIAGPAEARRRAVTEQWSAFGTRQAPTDTAGVVGYYAQDSKHGRFSPDQLEMRVFGDIAVARLARSVPDPKLTELNQEAGQTPPSQGVMIDAQGRLITQAVGFNGDHYLPFDLKNLKSMQGGQYVRTRATGGPTTEDIYTGLMTGVRQMQVVSNSGVFTVEFDPDLRGGRRYSDKAKKMVSRYAHLLDAVGNGSLYQQDIPGKVKAELYQSAMEQMNWDPKAGRDLYNDMLAQERLKSQAGVEEGFSGTEAVDERLDREAETEIAEYEANTKQKLTTGSRAQMKEDVLRDLKREARAGQAKPYRLDGEGYAAALAALQAEFPYYIRVVDHQELPEFFSQRKLGPAPRTNSPANDRAYVAPGHTQPNLRRGFIGEQERAGVGRYKRKPRENAAEVPEGTSTETGTREVTSTGARPGSTTPAPAAANFPIRFALDKDTKPLSEVIGPDSPAARKMTTLAGSVMKPFEMAYGDAIPAIDDAQNDDAALDAGSPVAYLAWKWNHFPLADRSRAFTQWVMSSKPTDDQRAAIVDALHTVDSLPVNNRDAMFVAAGGEDAWKKKRDDMLDLAELASPFAPPAADMDFAEPASGPNPKPQPYPWVLALGATPANYDRFLDSAEKQGHPIAGKVKAMSSLPDEAIATAVNQAIDKVRELKGPNAHPRVGEVAAATKDLSTLQAAWAFKHARDLAEAAEGRSPDPKVWGAQGAPTDEGDFGKRSHSLVPAHLAHSPVVKRLAIRLEPLSPAHR